VAKCALKIYEGPGSLLDLAAYCSCIGDSRDVQQHVHSDCRFFNISNQCNAMITSGNDSDIAGVIATVKRVFKKS